MAWVDCMRWRRAASMVRAAGWTISGLFLSGGAAAMFVLEAEGLSLFAMCVALCLIVLAVAHAISWLVERRAEQLVSR